MKSSFIGIPLAAIVLAVFLTTLGASAAHAQQSPCQPNPGPVDATDPSVIVAAPLDNASVSSPVHVEGQARVFEANVSLKLFDASGVELVSTFTNAAEGQVLSPFSTDVAFSVSTPTPACLWVFETSAQDGSAINVVQVPLTLLPPTLPSTGDGAATSDSMAFLWIAGGLAIAGAVFIGAGLPIRRRQT
ncbi:MAG: Gmad2 immunoglobulin-like domain-containing protein [Dehalococcoidia bacterium]